MTFRQDANELDFNDDKDAMDLVGMMMAILAGMIVMATAGLGLLIWWAFA